MPAVLNKKSFPTPFKVYSGTKEIVQITSQLYLYIITRGEEQTECDALNYDQSCSYYQKSKVYARRGKLEKLAEPTY